MATGNRLPENSQVITPILKTPLTDIFGSMYTQQGRPCGFFEAQFFKCMEAFGSKLGRLYCDLEHRDYLECLTHDKSKKRWMAIRNERRKKFWKGELDPAFLNDHPKPGEFQPDYFSWNYIC